MKTEILKRLFEHNHWANSQIIQACSKLNDAQLDAEPESATKGSLRFTIQHLVESQEDYRTQLLGTEPLFSWSASPTFAELQQAAKISGEGLIHLVGDGSSKVPNTSFEKDGYSIEPWVVIIQAINHATEHREQIKSMLSALGETPPRIDGWAYGKVSKALTLIETGN